MLTQIHFDNLLCLSRTVWYEMCSGSWPFKKLIPEAIIWQVGKGVKQSLAQVDVPREVKVSLYAKQEKSYRSALQNSCDVRFGTPLANCPVAFCSNFTENFATWVEAMIFNQSYSILR